MAARRLSSPGSLPNVQLHQAPAEARREGAVMVGLLCGSQEALAWNSYHRWRAGCRHHAALDEWRYVRDWRQQDFAWRSWGDRLDSTGAWLMEQG